jgi:hypothetical protein
VGLDYRGDEETDVGAILIRSLFTDGLNVQQDEDVDLVAPNTLNCNRASTWTAPSPVQMLLVELSGSTGSNDGLYLATITGNTSATIRTLDGSAPALLSEASLTANFFTIRYALGASISGSSIAYGDMTTNAVGAVEFYGVGGNNSSGIGKIIYTDPATMKYLWQVRKIEASGSSTRVFFQGASGEIYCRPDSFVGHSIYGDNAGTNTLYAGVYGYSEDVTGVFGKSVNHLAGLFQSSNYVGVRVQSWSTVANHHALEGRQVGGAAAAGVYGENSGSGPGVKGSSISGIGVYGNGIASFGVYGYTNSTVNAAVRGQSEILSGVAVHGSHIDGTNKGWGVVGWNNHLDPSTAAIDGAALGSGPGVRGSSVLGGGVKGESLLLFGVSGASIAGNGVIGTSYGYADVAGAGTNLNPLVYRVPLTEMAPYNRANWIYTSLGTHDHGWEIVAGSGNREIHWVWTDFYDGILVDGISIRGYHPGAGSAYTIEVWRKVITFELDTLDSYAWMYKSETWVQLLNASGSWGGAGTSNANYGPSSVTVFTAANLYQPARKAGASADIIGDELYVYITFDTTGVKLEHVDLSCQLNSANKWVGLTTT